MDFNFILKNIDPKRGFELIRLHLSNEIKIDAKTFDIFFNVKEKKISFDVFDSSFENGMKKFPYKGGEKFIDVGLHLLKEKMPKEFKDGNFEIDYAVIKSTPETIEGILYYSKDGVKQIPQSYKF